MLQLVVPEVPKRTADLISSLSTEIKTQYVFQMKKCNYEYQIYGLEGAPDRMELSNNLEAFKNIPKGTVKQGIETMKNIAFCGSPEMQDALVTISGLLHSLDVISFVDVDSPEFEDSLTSLKKFGEHQKSVIASGMLKITRYQKQNVDPNISV